MSESETSSEIKVKFQSSHTDNTNDKKPQSTDTDYYWGKIANQSKIITKTNPAHTETSELDDK
jgi:hypothetical protein